MLEDPDTLSKLGNVAGGTLGTLLSTGLNAGLGYATGGKEGAAAGAVQGLIMGGGAAMQHDKFKEAMGMGENKVAGVTPAPATAAASPHGTDVDISKITGPEAWQQQVNKGMRPLEGSSAVQEPPKVEAPAAEQKQGSKMEIEAPGYFELTGKLGMPAWTLGAGLASSMAYSNKIKQEEEERRRKKMDEDLTMQNLMAALYSPQNFSEGGLTVSSNAGAPTQVHFPDWFIDEFAHTGGLGGYATGGYLNTRPFDPDNAYPQSMIGKAQPYPATTPLRHEVVDMAEGGLLEGEGDGMSDHIPANIGGKEPVRVADGEYVVPAAAAQRFGEDRLHAMMDKVRAAAHAKKGKQIVENAGKRAFIQTMSKVKA